MTERVTLPVDSGFRELVAPSTGETVAERLEIEGALPAWLGGTLIRNGPGFFGERDSQVRHLFDGSAMLHAFTFGGGAVSYAGRFLRTRSYRSLRQDGRIGFREFASDPCRRLTDPITSLFDPRYTDNANVNVVRLGDRMVALTETPMPIEFDPVTLDTLGVAYRSPGRGPRSPTAHPHRDTDGSMLTVQVHYGPRCSYRIYRRTGRRFDLVATIPVARPAYLHSFAVTEGHIVLTEIPFRVGALDLLAARRPFIENYRWQPDTATQFLVLERATGQLTRYDAAPMFVFHHINAFDHGRDVVVDLVGYDDPAIIDALYLDAIHRGDTPIPAGRVRRHRLTSRRAVEEAVDDRPLEWPRINYTAHNGKPYRYVYGAGADLAGTTTAATTVTKIDLEGGQHRQWGEPGCYTGEPVFVPAPNGTGEDDGIVLTIVFDADTCRSSLLVLDAHDLTELAQVRAPRRIPFGFHGDHFANDS